MRLRVPSFLPAFVFSSQPLASSNYRNPVLSEASPCRNRRSSVLLRPGGFRRHLCRRPLAWRIECHLSQAFMPKPAPIRKPPPKLAPPRRRTPATPEQLERVRRIRRIVLHSVIAMALIGGIGWVVVYLKNAVREEAAVAQ